MKSVIKYLIKEIKHLPRVKSFELLDHVPATQNTVYLTVYNLDQTFCGDIKYVRDLNAVADSCVCRNLTVVYRGDVNVLRNPKNVEDIKEILWVYKDLFKYLASQGIERMNMPLIGWQENSNVLMGFYLLCLMRVAYKRTPRNSVKYSITLPKVMSEAILNK